MAETQSPLVRLSRREQRAMLGAVIGGVVLGIVVSLLTQESNPEIAKVFAAGAATLLFGAVLGQFVALLVADVDRGRMIRAAETQYISNILADLKSVYDAVDRGRSLISAHRSALTYQKEMLNVIDARIKLRNIERAVRFDRRGSSVTSIEPHVVEMRRYLDGLVTEFEDRYKPISREQSVYEARMKAATEKAQSEEELPADAPWKRIEALEALRDFLKAKDGSRFESNFVWPLDAASDILRSALLVELETLPASRRRPEPAGQRAKTMPPLATAPRAAPPPISSA